MERQRGRENWVVGAPVDTAIVPDMYEKIQRTDVPLRKRPEELLL